MRNSTVSAPVPSCSAPLTSSSKKYAAVELLTKQILYFTVEPKTRAKELYAQTCAHLGNLGMLDCELFGLAVVSDGEYLFVDPDNKLSKYAPKNWRSSHTHGLDANGKPSLVLYFRVQFYVDSPLLLRDELTRHHYYLQLRHNVQTRGLLPCSGDEEVLLLLAGYALQADMGDFLEEAHSATPYFQPQDYLPSQLALDQKTLQSVSALHRDNHGISKAEAELQYIREASSTEVSPITHNAHLYRLKHKKQEQGQGSVWMAVCAKGIEIYEENSSKSLTATFLWNNIGKLCFDRKKFEIRALNWSASGEKYTYYTSSDEKSKHLLFLCRVTHQFSMAIQPRLSEVRRKEEEERKRYRDCYMYSRSLGVEFPSLAKLAGNYKGHHSDQRISVISNTSSNTTSGIVSDRVQSLDESEDDLEIEIMINSPPAPSVESLALAHLRDVPDVLQARDSSDPSPLSHSSKGGNATEGASPPLVAGIPPQKQSPNSSTAVGGAATPATTDGSQCSSSCSTVVIAGGTLTLSGGGSTGGTVDVRRRASTSSSLELGYSHTAQNSAVSDSTSVCPELELDYSVQSAHTSSGIYTLRSSCGTTADTVETNACSSETSGVYAVCSTNSIANTSDSCHGAYSVIGTTSARARVRSGSSAGSVISGSGSFRGDGSDPSEAGPRSPLTAEELSDLIVGRGSGSGHASGVYPSRATVSSTLDSDSDYVTLPPPPMPPPRTDSDKNFLLLEPSSLSSSVASAAMVSSALSIEDDADDVVSLPPPPPYTPQPLSQQNLMSQQQSLEHLHTFHPQNLELLSQQEAFTHQSLLAQQQLLNQAHHGSPNHHHLLPQQPHQNSSCLLPSSIPISVEEANARFITTKPHINILTAHTSLVASTAAPSYAAPTMAYQTSFPTATSPANSCANGHQLRMYPPGDARTHPPTHVKNIGANSGNGSSFLGYAAIPDPGSKMKPTPVQTLVPIIGKNNYLDVHASRANASNPPAAFMRSTVAMSPPPPPPPSSSYQFHQRQFSPPPPPPVLHPRQPPPPPPPPVASTGSQPSLATVYTSQVTRSQIEQFQQQMYSDVDYVIYPMKDPAVSKQEYIDAKQGSLIAAGVRYPRQQMAYPPPPYPSYRAGPKSHFMYRSTPNVAMASGYLPVAFGSSTMQPASPPPIKYASNQNLSSVEPLVGYAGFSPSPYLSASQYSSSTSPLYSAGTSYSSSSTRSLRYESQMQPFSASAADLLHMSVSKLLPSTSHPPMGGFGRARSDDNILNSYEKPKGQSLLERPKYRRLPPPPPPPPYDQQVSQKLSPSLPQPAMSSESPKASVGDESDGMLDIRTLREKSKNLDLPLISALCNDRSLLKQTNAFVMPRHPGQGEKKTSGASGNSRSERPVSWHVETVKASSSITDGKSNGGSEASPNRDSSNSNGSSSNNKPQKTMLLASLLASKSLSPGSKHSSYSSSKLKYPVSGLSTTQISKPQRKISASTHIHPTHPHQQQDSSKSSSSGVVKSGQSLVNTSKLGAVGRNAVHKQHRDIVLP